IASFFPGGQTHQKGLSVGIQEKTITGAEWALEWSMTRTWDNSNFYTLQPRYEPTLTLEITQPLLRDAWPAFNLAGLELASVNHRATAEAFREKVEEVVTQVISSYWQYVRARGDYEIQQRLLAETIDTQRKVAARVAQGLASPLQVDQINASAEARRTELFRAQKLVVDTRDALARRLADAQISVLTDYEVIPETKMSDARLIRDMKDQLLTALRYSPILARARLAIEAEAINVRVAENQALPRLDLTASTGFQGLGDEPYNARRSLFTGDYASYRVGLSIEYPLGNRERLAELRRSRLSREKAVANMQNIADEVALALRERIRQVNTSFAQVEAFDQGVKAAKAYRDKLEITVSPELGEAMTPERLQLLLSAQGLVASLERGRLQAVTDYNNAMIDLARVKGTVLELNRVRLAMPLPAEGDGAEED
ncbi:MAG: TolC family protein, partial [Planctomycetota bacterium]